jgi:hypothetical protein
VVDLWAVCFAKLLALEKWMLSRSLDIIFGGKYGMSVANQQFTVRNVTTNNAKHSHQWPQQLG